MSKSSESGSGGMLSTIVGYLKDLKEYDAAQTLRLVGILVVGVGIGLWICILAPGASERVLGSRIENIFAAISLGGLLAVMGVVVIERSRVIASPTPEEIDAAVPRPKDTKGELRLYDSRKRLYIKSVRLPHGIGDRRHAWFVVTVNGLRYPQSVMVHDKGVVDLGPLYIGSDNEEHGQYSVSVISADEIAHRELDRYSSKSAENWDWPGIAEEDWPRDHCQELLQANVVLG